MSLFPLDSVRNAAIDREVEPVLEDLREEVSAFPFWREVAGDLEGVLEVYDLARPRLNVLVSSLRDMEGAIGVDIGTGFGFLPVLLTRYGVRAMATEQEPALSRFAT